MQGSRKNLLAKRHPFFVDTGGIFNVPTLFLFEFFRQSLDYVSFSFLSFLIYRLYFLLFFNIINN